MNPSDADRTARLAQELERVRHELAQLQKDSARSGALRSARLVSAVPLLLLGTWVLSAGAPASQDDLAQRVSELEARLLKGPGSTTRIQAPFEVVDGGGNVILQVMQGIPTTSNGVGIFTSGQYGGVIVSRGGHDIAGLGTADGGDGGMLYIADKYGIPRSEVRATDGVNVLDEGGKVVASMYALKSSTGRFAIMRGEKMIASLEAGEEGGTLDISDERGKTVAQLGIDEGNGYVATMDPRGNPEVEMGVSEKGEPQLAVSEKGKVRAALAVSAGAGHLAVWNAKDLVVANVTGKGTADGGAVTVGNGSGKGVANLTAGADGSGLVQVFQPGAGSVAVMTQDKSGGLLQIKNGNGTPVASLKAASDGGGYWQLTDPAGNPVVEGGEAEGRGIVRAGPYYRCSATAQAVPLIGVARLPDCIIGRDKQ
jgi:hypothetical protein